MTSFHPTLSPRAFVTYLWRSRRPHDPAERLRELFPEQRAELTDSGRSAFALVLEALELRGKTLLMPAYVCDVFYPVLRTYDIKPIFLDVDPAIYQPPLSAYTDELLNKADAALLVATYGRRPDDVVISRIQNSGTVVIEDYAMRSPLLREPLAGSARIYSLPKTIPMPDGGLAVLPKSSNLRALPQGPSRSSLKSVLKLLPGVALLVAALRDALARGQSAPSWDGIADASALTRTIFAEYSNEEAHVPPGPFPYCHPLRVEDPARAAQMLTRRGIHAERIWNRPIVANPDVQEHYALDPRDYPETMRIAERIVCAPLWHITDEKTFEKYTLYLQKVSASDRSK